MKLTVVDAVKYVQRARESMVKTDWRLGQALFVSLPGPICDEHRGLETDFFYWLDDEKVLTCFYENYVEDN